jgi:hypothetical protein
VLKTGEEVGIHLKERIHQLWIQFAAAALADNLGCAHQPSFQRLNVRDMDDVRDTGVEGQALDRRQAQRVPVPTGECLVESLADVGADREPLGETCGDLAHDRQRRHRASA